METSSILQNLNTTLLSQNTPTKLEYFGEWSYPCIGNIQYGAKNRIDFVVGSDAHTPKDVGLGIKDVLLEAKNIGLDRICYFENRNKKFIEICELLRV